MLAADLFKLQVRVRCGVKYFYVDTSFTKGASNEGGRLDI